MIKLPAFSHLLKLESMILGYLKKHQFKEIQSFCMFFGYPRSGHSLIGALLDAHPNMMISHELDALGYICHTITKNQLFYLIERNSKRFESKGRRWTGYDYQVDREWYGNENGIRVIGDKKGGMSTDRYFEDPVTLTNLCRKVAVPVKVIHVIRNPFDIITTRYIKGVLGKGLSHEERLRTLIDDHFRMVSTIQEIKKEPSIDILDVYLEQLILSPQRELGRLLEYLQVPYIEEYVSSCSNRLFKKPKETRHQIEWPGALIDRVINRISKDPALQKYQFD